MFQHIEHAIFRFFNSTCHCAVLDKTMPYITEIASGELIFIAALILLFFKKREKVMCGILLMAGSTFSYHTAHFLKNLIERPRPFNVLAEVYVLMPLKGFSFPSGHATMAFMAAFILTNYFKKWYIFYPLALVVGFSRMYLGVHYPLDIIAGAILGSIIGFVLTRVADARN